MSIYNKQVGENSRIIPEIAQYFNTNTQSKFTTNDILKLIKDNPLQSFYIGSDIISSTNNKVAQTYYIAPKLIKINQSYNEIESNINNMSNLSHSSLHALLEPFSDVNQYFVTPPTFAQIIVNSSEFKKIGIVTIDDLFSEHESLNTTYREVLFNVYNSSELCIGSVGKQMLKNYFRSANLGSTRKEYPINIVEDSILNFWQARTNTDLSFHIHTTIAKLHDLNLIDDEFIENNDNNIINISRFYDDEDEDGDCYTGTFTVGFTLIYKAQLYFIQRENPNLNINEITKDFYTLGQTFWKHYENGEEYINPLTVNHLNGNKSKLIEIIDSLPDVIELEHTITPNLRNEYLISTETSVYTDAPNEINNLQKVESRQSVETPDVATNLEKSKIEHIINSLKTDFISNFIRENRNNFKNNNYDWSNVELKMSSQKWMGDVYLLRIQLTGNLITIPKLEESI